MGSALESRGAIQAVGRDTGHGLTQAETVRRRRALRRHDDERKIGTRIHKLRRAVDFHAREVVVAALAESVQEQEQRPGLALGLVRLRHEQQVANRHVAFLCIPNCDRLR